MDFTNREIAGYFWLAVFLGWSVRSKDVRGCIRHLLQTIVQWRILLLFGLAATYVSACVVGLAKLGIWTSDNLKTTVLWAITFAVSTMMNVHKVTDTRLFVGKTLRDVFAITGALTFMVELYSFSLGVELVAVPLITLIGLLHVAAKHDKQHAVVEKLLERILSVIGTLYLSYSCYQSVIAVDEFASLSTLREFGVPMALSILYIPYLCGLILLFVYERVFVRIQWSIGDERLRKAAKWQAFLTFGTNVHALERWARSVARTRPENREGILESFAEARKIAMREAKPQRVKKELGWAPYEAKNFLVETGLPTGDYDRAYEDQWFASSKPLEIGDAILPNNISYYVNGSDFAANELKLTLNVSTPSDADYAEARFQEVGKILLSTALGEADAIPAILEFSHKDTFELPTEGGLVRYSINEWSGGIEGGYSRTLLVSR